MKMDCVIILGPSGEFHPLVTEEFPKFTLPFMNTPLINLSLNYLVPFASKFFIVCLEKHVKTVNEILECAVPIEFITTTSYEGMGFIINILKPRIKTSHFIMCKGDIYGLEPLKALLESFIKSNDDLYVSISKSSKESPIMCIDTMNYLKMYNSNEIPLLKNQKYLVTIEYYIKDFFIFKTSGLGTLDNSLYCFKNNVLPFLIQNKLRIRVGENMIVQIRSMEDYLSQLDFKNHLLGSLESYVYNLVDPECHLADNIEIEDSVIGANVIIGDGCVVKRSIIMDDAVIQNDCHIESCIVGRGCVIYYKSELRDCKVANKRDFKHTIKAFSNVFTNEW
ncbi:uncharacterized protein VICG_01629 [Vittaforma corneae ATCC 50505]|uniref:Translation initiation factor eIF2B subunit gamma n=1 Tax=Vittaforma corneae (strain ATCC 50505) TaxID=993615 RepID=L2GKH6_VITCO|nr:uncharacterized protein VICG_01629 [Vittaforma corneae ATCC 50505]ELA41388.1 hypothetical protein VICG_01629 [Vittaforma corneae ATCC 50505]